MQSRQSGRETKGKPSRSCSQKIPRTFRSTRGRVAGQHAHGFLMGSRLVETERNAERMVQQWHSGKEKLGKDDLDAREREGVLYTLANVCITMMREKRGVVGDVARAIGRSLIVSPIDPTHIQRYFGDLKGFGAVDELVTMVTGGVPVNAADTEVDLECTLQYGNHRGVSEHLPAIWKKIGEDVRRQKC